MTLNISQKQKTHFHLMEREIELNLSHNDDNTWNVLFNQLSILWIISMSQFPENLMKPFESQVMVRSASA